MFENNEIPPNPSPSLTLSLTENLNLHPGSVLSAHWLNVSKARSVIIDRSAKINGVGLGDDNIGGGIDFKDSGASGGGHGGSGGSGHKQVLVFG